MNTTDILARLERLESELTATRRVSQRYRLASVGLLLALLAGIAVAAATPASEVVRTRKIEVVDANGKIVFSVAATQDGGQFDLWNNSGQNLLRASCNPAGGDLAIWNTTGHNVYGAFATADGGECSVWSSTGNRSVRTYAHTEGGRIDLHNAKDRPLWSASVSPTGGILSVKNASEQVIAAIDATESGDSRLRLADASGHVVVKAAASAQGGQVDLLNAQGAASCSSGVTSAGAGYMTATNALGAPIFKASAESNGGGRLDLGNESGKVVFTVTAEQQDGAALALLNQNGRKMFAVGATPLGGLLNLYNSSGLPVFIAGYGPDGRSGAMSLKNGRGVTVISAMAGEQDRGQINVWDADGKKSRNVSP